VTRKPLSRENPMNSPVILEVSPEGSSGLWRERFMKKKYSKPGTKREGVMPWLQLQFDYDTTTTRLRYDYDTTTTYRPRLLPFDASKKMNMSIFRRSRVVVESQLWYRLNRWWEWWGMRMKQVNWCDHKAVMSQEETGEVVADEMSQEVDPRNEVMHIEKSDQ